MKLAVRAFIVTLLFLASLLFLTKTPVFAQSQTPPQPVNSYITPNTNPDVPTNLHTWTQNVLIEVMAAMTCQLAGVDPTNPSAKCLGVDQKTGKIGFVEKGGGAIGVMSTLIIATFNAPVHTGDYLSYLSQNFGLSKPTYAAGESGINSLSPLLSIWKIFRDITYTLFTLIFVVIGLGIMLRIKIDPRTVMTIQNQIPKIIVGLLLVTFSFAIAGLLIDIMWITIYLFINIAARADSKLLPPEIASRFYESSIMFANYVLGSTPAGGLNEIAGKVSIGIGGMAFTLVGGSVPQDPVSLVLTAITPGAWLAFILQLLFGTIVGIIAFLIIVIAIIWSLFKLWFALLEAYIMILIDVIFAPFWIVASLIPGGGQSIGFGAWLRDILGNLSAFPVTIGMFLLGKVLVDKFGAQNTTGQFAPPLVGNPADTSTIGAIIALGIIFTTPHVVKMTKQAFKSPKIDLGPIGKSVGIGTSVVAAPPRRIGQALVGTDKYGNTRPLTAWVETKFGSLAGTLTGGQLNKKNIVKNPFGKKVETPQESTQESTEEPEEA